MKLFSYQKRYLSLLVIISVLGMLLLVIGGGCTTYNPRTGMYEPDPGKTMIAVGSAALAGSIIYHEANRDRYHRPPYHYHYHRPPGPPPRRYR